jgi:hypothetical protein
VNEDTYATIQDEYMERFITEERPMKQKPRLAAVKRGE